MRRRTMFRFVDLCVVLAALAIASPGAEARETPNVLVIVLDDVGVDKIGAYGEHPNPPPTPNIDALAQQGLLFRRFWAHSNCSPARASFLTGRYAYRHGIGTAVTYFADGAGLSTDETMIPEAIPHRSVALGKWHVQTNAQTLDHPLHSGFDIFAGTPAQVYTIPGGDEGYSLWMKNINGTLTLSDVYATTDTANDTVAAVSGGLIEPWFVLTNFQSAHKPLHVPPQHLHTQGEPTDDVRMHRAMVESMDTEIGRILESVDLTDTIVILFGDNGTLGTVMTPPFPIAHGKGSPYEGGVRVPLIVAGPGVAVGECNGLAQIQDLFPTIIELAGEAAPPSDGVSMRPYLRNPQRESLRAWTYTERFSPNGMSFGMLFPAQTWTRVIRGERYKVIQRMSAGVIEFYDLRTDPFEHIDLMETGPLSDNEQVEFDALMTVLNELEADAMAQ